MTTTLNDAVEKSLSTIREIDEKVAKLQEEAKLARQAAFEPFLESLAASGEVSLIVIYGYTPGFNDGEPCEHSGDFFVNIAQAKSDDCFERGIDALEGEEFEWIEQLQKESSYNYATRSYDINTGAMAHNEKLCAEHGHVYKAPSDEIIKAINDVIFETCEEENGTDYYVVYILKDGKFERHSGAYDCGY